jgi:hypothetical protein
MLKNWDKTPVTMKIGAGHFRPPGNFNFISVVAQFVWLV